MRTKLSVAIALAGTLLATCLVSGSAKATSVPVLKVESTSGIVTLVRRGGGGGGRGISRGGGGRSISRGGGGRHYAHRNYGNRNYGNRNYGNRNYGNRNYGHRNYGTSQLCPSQLWLSRWSLVSRTLVGLWRRFLLAMDTCWLRLDLRLLSSGQ